MDMTPSMIVREAFANLPNRKLVAVLADLVATHAHLDDDLADDDKLAESSNLGILGDALEYALDKMYADKLDKLKLYVNSIKEDEEYWADGYWDNIFRDEPSRRVFYIDVSEEKDAAAFINKMREAFNAKRGQSSVSSPIGDSDTDTNFNPITSG